MQSKAGEFKCSVWFNDQNMDTAVVKLGLWLRCFVKPKPLNVYLYSGWCHVFLGTTALLISTKAKFPGTY